MCPWGKSSSKSPEPGTRLKPTGPLGREQLQGNCNGRRIEAFNAECNALKDYDNRMARLLAKQALSPPPHAPPGLSTSQSTTRSVASTMSFTGGAERTRCRKCGKLVLTTTLRLHRDACVVVKLGGKLGRLKELANNPPPPTNAADAASPSPSTSLNQSAGHQSASQPRRSTARPVAAALDLPEAYARLDEMDSLLAALSAVVNIPAGLRRGDGVLADRRVKAAVPEIEAAFDDWKADVAAKVAAAPPPGVSATASTLAAPRGASPAPGLRAVAHRPPADLSPTKTKRADDAAIQRCAELAGTKSAAAQEAAVFDAEVLALADAVRRGDLTLADATLPNHGVFRSTGYAVAVNPTLRNSSPEAA